MHNLLCNTNPNFHVDCGWLRKVPRSWETWQLLTNCVDQCLLTKFNILLALNVPGTSFTEALDMSQIKGMFRHKKNQYLLLQLWLTSRKQNHLRRNHQIELFPFSQFLFMTSFWVELYLEEFQFRLSLTI